MDGQKWSGEGLGTDGPQRGEGVGTPPAACDAAEPGKKYDRLLKEVEVAIR